MNPLYIVVICNYDPYGAGRYCYTFDNRCKEMPELRMGDEVTKLILSTKGKNEKEVPKELVDFLHYVTESNEKGLPKQCDERLKRLHENVQRIKSSTDVEVEYMKMEERERIIREEGAAEGRQEGMVLGRREGIELGRQEGLVNGKREAILELLEELGNVPENVKTQVMSENDLEVLKEWLHLAAKAGSIEEFLKEIKR